MLEKAVLWWLSIRKMSWSQVRLVQLIRWDWLSDSVEINHHRRPEGKQNTTQNCMKNVIRLWEMFKLDMCWWSEGGGAPTCGCLLRWEAPLSSNLFAAVRSKTAVINPLHDLLSPEKQTDTANVSMSGLSCSCKNDMGPDAQYGLLHRTIFIEGNSRHFQQVPGRRLGKPLVSHRLSQANFNQSDQEQENTTTRGASW